MWAIGLGSARLFEHNYRLLNPIRWPGRSEAWPLLGPSIDGLLARSSMPLSGCLCLVDTGNGNRCCCILRAADRFDELVGGIDMRGHDRAGQDRDLFGYDD